MSLPTSDYTYTTPCLLSHTLILGLSTCRVNLYNCNQLYIAAIIIMACIIITQVCQLWPTWCHKILLNWTYQPSITAGSIDWIVCWWCEWRYNLYHVTRFGNLVSYDVCHHRLEYCKCNSEVVSPVLRRTTIKWQFSRSRVSDDNCNIIIFWWCNKRGLKYYGFMKNYW